MIDLTKNKDFRYIIDRFEPPNYNPPMLYYTPEEIRLLYTMIMESITTRSDEDTLSNFLKGAYEGNFYSMMKALAELKMNREDNSGSSTRFIERTAIFLVMTPLDNVPLLFARATNSVLTAMINWRFKIGK